MKHMPIAGANHGPAVIPGMAEHDHATLRQIVDRVVAEADPISVILFGSRARGQARPQSDADLLVVVAGRDDLREQWASVLDAVALYPIEADVVLTTPEEFAWRSQVPGFVQYAAARDGWILYERG